MGNVSPVGDIEDLELPANCRAFPVLCTEDRREIAVKSNLIAACNGEISVQ